jgi:hypothetical protein
VVCWCVGDASGASCSNAAIAITTSTRAAPPAPHQVWFAVNGSEPRFGFGGLPDRVFPTVSIRAPAVLAFHSRSSSWWEAAGAGAGPAE